MLSSSTDWLLVCLGVGVGVGDDIGVAYGSEIWKKTCFRALAWFATPAAAKSFVFAAEVKSRLRLFSSVTAFRFDSLYLSLFACLLDDSLY